MRRTTAVPHGPPERRPAGDHDQRWSARPHRVVLISASIGAGHDGVAEELARRLRALGLPTECVDFVPLWPGGALLKAGYARQLRVAPRTWGWLLGSVRRGLLSAVVVAWAALGSARRVRAVVDDASLVVATYPLAAQAVGRLRRRGQLTAPAVTVLTDMSVHPLWVAAGVDAHLALHEVAAGQARRLGAAAVHVVGPAIRPAFRADPPNTADRSAARAVARSAFGLPPQGQLALVVAGSWGVGAVTATVADLLDTGLAAPVVACGHNDDLRAELASWPGVHPVGWTDTMATLMRACDVVVQNAGGLSALEAMACGVPVLSYRCVPGHGTTNAAALHAAGWAPWARTPAELAKALSDLGSGTLSVPDWEIAADPAELLASMAKQSLR